MLVRTCVCVNSRERGTRFCARPCVQRYYVTPCIEVSDPNVRTERARRVSDFRARIAVKNHENSADGACVHTAVAFDRHKQAVFF